MGHESIFWIIFIDFLNKINKMHIQRGMQKRDLVKTEQIFWT